MFKATLRKHDYSKFMITMYVDESAIPRVGDYIKLPAAGEIFKVHQVIWTFEPKNVTDPTHYVTVDIFVTD